MPEAPGQTKLDTANGTKISGKKAARASERTAPMPNLRAAEASGLANEKKDPSGGGTGNGDLPKFTGRK